MRSLRIGIWSFSHQALDWIGRGAVWLLSRKASLQEDTAYAATGGALVSGIFGAVVGIILSDRSHDIHAVGGAVLGGLFGVCMGIIFGSIVAVIDDSIKDMLKSLDSK
jgi:hypothetical protein